MEESGAWLTVVPDWRNDSALSAEEFRDNLRLRYASIPLKLRQRCDGCGKKLTVEHALSCVHGGLVMVQHNNVSQE
eukprot:3029745-Ditylum_brightwellii.AAC.1